MKLKEKYKRLIEYFAENNPNASSELTYGNPFQLLVAVVLSAQCTDKRVNMVTPKLFEKYGSAEQMSLASIEEILTLIKSISYPNSKAKHLSEISKMIVEEFGGEVPRTMEELQRLPGVGRKTANVMMAVAFGQPAMPVDTHVFRVAARIGLVENAKTPLDTELQLTENIPAKWLSTAHHWLLLHGRYTCTAHNPHCTECGINDICDFYSKSH